MLSMDYPVLPQDDGIKINPEKMEKEKFYHCIFQNKLVVFYKDDQEILNCYEIEEEELIQKAKSCNNDTDLEKVFEDYIKRENLKH